MRFAAWMKLGCQHEEEELAVREDGELYTRCTRCKRETW